MCFFVVGVFGSVAFDGSGHFLDGIGFGGDGGTVGFENANETDVHFFAGGVVAEDEFAELLDAGVTLNLDAGGKPAFAGAVVFKSCGEKIFLDDKRFL